MNRRRNHSNRRGITRVEVIVVLAACLLVGMLFLPATRSARGPARKIQCLSNMRNVGLAAQNFASSNNGKLPPLSSSQTVRNSTGEEGEFIVNWATLLLPALDNSALLKQIRLNAIIESGQARIGDEKQMALDVFSCPLDPNAFKRPGRLSFVFNTGFISQDVYHSDPGRKHIPGSLAWVGLPGESDAIAVHAATGAVWHQSDGFESSLDYISQGDGTSVTLLLTENLQAGNWYDTDTASISFGFPVPNSKGKVPLGAGRIFESEEKPLNTEFDHGTLTTATGQDWRINADLKAKVGTLPRPSSNHVGGVNVIMCDGAGRFLNENIDPHIYLKLLTANGAIYGEGKLQESSY